MNGGMPACSVCSSETEELRPYGKNGAWICFDCMTKSPERQAEAKRQFAAQCEAAGSVVIIGGSTGPRPIKRGQQ